MKKYMYVDKKQKDYRFSFREGTFHTLEDICQIKGDGRTFHTDEARHNFVVKKLGLEVIRDQGEEGVVIMDMPQGRRRVRYGIEHAAEKGTHSEFDKKNKDEQIGAPPSLLYPPELYMPIVRVGKVSATVGGNTAYLSELQIMI